MIKLFKNNETDFTHNENVLSNVISCKVTEEINEDYTMELEYPLEDTKNISSNLVTASIISTPTIDSRDNQQFRIIQKETHSNSISVQSQSKLLADLKENRIRAMTIVGKTRKEAIQIILDNALDPHNYKVGNLDTNPNTNVILEVKEGNLLSAIIGSENSVLSEYGGEFIVSNDTIDIVDQRGQDNGVVTEYGKNISSIKETIDNTDLATVLIPRSGDYRLPEYCIESPNVKKYEKRYFKEVDLSLNIWDGKSEKGEGQITLNEAYKIMRDTCNKMFVEDKVDQLKFNYSIDFIELSKTEEYKNYKILETVHLGDKVYVKHKKLNLDLQGRVNKITYTVDSEGITTIDKVEIGFSRQSITDIINSTIKSIKFTEQNILLQVSNLDNTLTSKIEMTAEQIQSTVTDTKNQLQSQITQTAGSLTSAITDTKNNLQSQITQQAGQIQTTVSDLNGAKSQITQLNNQISSKVDEGEISSLIEQNAEAVTIAIHNQTDMNVTFDSSGQTIQNGAFKIKDKNGNIVMWIRSDGIVMVKDLYFDNAAFSKTSNLSSALANMEGITLSNLGIGHRLTIHDSDFYIYYNGEGGYDLNDYVRTVAYKLLQDKGLV